MTTGLIADRAEIVGKLHEIKLARDAKNEAQKFDSAGTEQVKQWMSLNWDELDTNRKGEAYLDDGEHGIRAVLATRASATWDLRHAPVEVILYLAHEGLLDVKDAAFRERRQSAPDAKLDDAMKYRHEGESVSLRFEVIR